MTLDEMMSEKARLQKELVQLNARLTIINHSGDRRSIRNSQREYVVTLKMKAESDLIDIKERIRAHKAKKNRGALADAVRFTDYDPDKFIKE